MCSPWQRKSAAGTAAACFILDACPVGSLRDVLLPRSVARQRGSRNCSGALATLKNGTVQYLGRSIPLVRQAYSSASQVAVMPRAGFVVTVRANKRPTERVPFQLSATAGVVVYERFRTALYGRQVSVQS